MREGLLMAAAVQLGSEFLASRTPAEVVRAAVDLSRQVLDADVTFAALPEGGGTCHISISNGIRDPRFHEVHVRPSRGIGGKVLLEERPLRVADYPNDPDITHDYVAVVSNEGLQSVACVQIFGPSGLQALLYAGDRGLGVFGDVAVARLEDVARHAHVCLHEIACREREMELARIRERQALAVRLHDSVAQALFAIGATAQYSQNDPDPEALLAAMREIESASAGARRELREALYRLADSGDGIAFDARLDGELRLFERTTDCKVRVVRRGTARPLPNTVQQLLIDGAIEGLRNAVKHAATRLAFLDLAYEHNGVRLAVETEIVGRDRPSVSGVGTGTGLDLLRKRARVLGGELALTTNASGLKVLRIELPLSAQDAAGAP
jgi:LuxR family transcriptional regulator, regulator of acetate metabolism